jgi:tetratricopeptide (TPR) repeat protein
LKLIAVPVRSLAKLLDFTQMVNTTALWESSYRLSQNIDDATKALLLIFNKRGLELAHLKAMQMFEQTHNCWLIATIGCIEYACGKCIKGLKDWLEVANTENIENEEALLHLKLLLSEFSDSYDQQAIVEEILSHNDLPSHFTLSALVQKMNNYIDSNNWQCAKVIADRLLQVQPQVDAAMALWVIAKARGNEKEADILLKKARAVPISNTTFETVYAQGWLYLGDVNNAMKHLSQGCYDEFWVTQARSDIGILARSDEFKNYCKEKN